MAIGISNDENDKLVDFARETRDYLGDQLKEIHQKAADNWKRYFAKRDDPRGPTEKWRSLVSIPQVYWNTEAKTAQLTEMLMSADPPIQPDPVTETAEADAKAITDTLDYTMRINYFRTKFLAPTLRGVSVQGLEFYKNTWKRRAVSVPNRASMKQVQDFQKALKDASDALQLPVTAIPSWVRDPERFNQWRELVNKSQRVTVPPPPDLSGKPSEVVTFWGPYIERLPFWDVFADPMIQEMTDQPVIIHEMFMPRDWLDSRTGDDPSLPYDPKRVAEAMRNWSGQQYSNEQEQQAQNLSIPATVRQNPQVRNAVKIWELWRPNSEFQFTVVLNEECVINKTPRLNPYEHGQSPIGAMRNVVIGGYLYGVSDVEPVTPLLDEQDTLRSLRLDKVTLHTLPIFQKLQTFGIPDLQKKFKPGGIIDVPRLDGIKELISGDVNPSAFAEGDRVALDVDRGYGIGDNVRGGQATVNRTSATEQASRLTQALTRLKLNAIQIEDDLNYGVSQWLSMWAQFGDSESRPSLAGYDFLAKLDREKFLTALAQDYRLRGATQSVSRDLQAQQLMMFGDKFNAQMLPQEVRHLMREVGMALGLRGMSKIVSVEGDQTKTQEYQNAQQAAIAQNTASAAQNRTATAAAAAPASVKLS